MSGTGSPRLQCGWWGPPGPTDFDTDDSLQFHVTWRWRTFVRTRTASDQISLESDALHSRLVCSDNAPLWSGRSWPPWERWRTRSRRSGSACSAGWPPPCLGSPRRSLGSRSPAWPPSSSGCASVDRPACLWWTSQRSRIHLTVPVGGTATSSTATPALHTRPYLYR